MLYKNTPAHFRQEVCGLFFVCMQNRRDMRQRVLRARTLRHFAKALGYRNALCGSRGCWNGTNCTLQQWGLHRSALCGTLRKQSVGFKPPFFKGWLKPCPQSQPLVPKIQPSVVNDEGLYLVGEDGFGPRTKKQSTGLFFASSMPCCPHLIFSSQKYDPPPYRRRVILGGRGWIRTIEAK